jgi:peptide/nickel transport system substrate-binding protein
MEQKTSFWQNLVRERNLVPLEKTQGVFESFSITEKFLFLFFASIFIGASLSLASRASHAFGSDIPSKGGQLVEGIIGTPRFINPLLAASDADRDLTSLVYSGLLKATPAGEYIPDIAEDYSISPDGLVYTFTIRPDATFHDGEPVTADDVKFTVEKALDNSLKSPRRVNWEGVTIEKTDARTITFTLKQPYAPFITNLTTGILPRHLWQNLESDQMPFSSLNIEAVGSGPYKISSVKKSSDGIPTSIVLHANEKYVLGEPYISKIVLKFFGSERNLTDALHDGDIESASNITPASAKSLEGEVTIMSSPLTRVFGVFFNQNENELLARKEIRKALSLAIDKDEIIQSVLYGYGTQADGPLPNTVSFAGTKNSSTTSGMELAASTLAKAKWIKNPATNVLEQKGSVSSSSLSFSLSTANVPELVEVAKKIEGKWTELGAKVDTRVFESGDLNQGVIRPRKYEALLFGIVTGKNSDLYPFWHSSQRNDPGLNISLYTNAKADKLLEAMRTATSSALIAKNYAALKTEIDNDTPAAFIWSPSFIYAVPKKLQGIRLGEITTPSDRFTGIEKWYVKTDHVWNIFLEDKSKIIGKN